MNGEAKAEPQAAAAAEAEAPRNHLADELAIQVGLSTAAPAPEKVSPAKQAASA